MNIHVFVGPTLSRGEVHEALPNAGVLGPVAFGDVYRAVKAGAQVIAIVDGFFESVPAVWHKEILWAMSEGVHVFGASSMGALRGSELADFGMVGIGAIYEAYRSGELEDDDEVAVAHASAESDFAPGSEAMVNIRATALAARESGVISEPTRRTLTNVAKRRFYAERSYAQALRDAAKEGCAPAELAAFRAWLASGKIDQKAADARQLMLHIRDWLLREPGRMQVRYRLEPTDAWMEACRIADATSASQTTARSVALDALEEELKLAGVYVALVDAAAARASAIHEARSAGFQPDVQAVTQAAELLRKKLGLEQSGDYEAWRTREHIDPPTLVRLFEDEACVLWSAAQTAAAARAHLIDCLRMGDQYGHFNTRAELKMRNLAALRGRPPALHDLGVTEIELWRWFFEQKLGRPVADDLPRFARRAGFADLDEMRSAVARDLYCARMNEAAPERRTMD